jgi:hypothetical protein
MARGRLFNLEHCAEKGELWEPQHYYVGWQAPFELHNGNVYALVFWRGRLIKIEDAPKILDRKYYDRYRGKEVNEYEWTVLKRYLLAKIEGLDKEFKKSLRKKKSELKAKKK